MIDDESSTVEKLKISVLQGGAQNFSIKHDNNINNYFTFCMEWERLSTILL